MTRSVILDIETHPLDDAAEFIEEPSAPANYKDPDKIAAYIAEKRAESLARCALDIDLCRVVAVGWADETGEYVEVAPTEADERVLLATIYLAIKGARCVIGFNHLGFDLPVLIRRGQYLGLTVPEINMDRYRTPHVDLLEKLSFNGKIKYRGLAFYCKRFGIDVPDPIAGKDVGALVREGKWEDVAAHCRADVLKTKALAHRLGYVTMPDAVAV